VVLDSTRTGTMRGMSWSHDGLRVAFVRREGGKQQLAKTKPVAGAAPLVLANGIQRRSNSTMPRSPTVAWVAHPSAEGISMISRDGNTVGRLTARDLTRVPVFQRCC